MSKIAWHALLWVLFCIGIMVFLGSCVDPINPRPFMENEKVQAIINPPGGGLTIANFSPLLEISRGIGGYYEPLLEAETVTFSLSNPDQFNIIVANAGQYYDVVDDEFDIEWTLFGHPANPILNKTPPQIYIDDSDLLLPLSAVGTYTLFVEGGRAGNGNSPYSTTIYIRVIE
ncbi:MAG: hypothetical protein LBH07_02880 [Treponema sp.]|nr:hypothetical protein [Treponema sp.]